MADGSVTIEIKGDAGPIDETLSKVGEQAKASLSGAFDGVGATASSAASAVSNSFGDALGDIDSYIDDIDAAFDELRNDPFSTAAAGARNLDSAADAAGNAVGDIVDEANRAANAVDDLGNKMDGAGGKTSKFGGLLKSAFAGGIAGIAAAATSAIVGGVKQCIEMSREYQTEMGKLNVAFTQSGFSAEAAEAAYMGLAGILGETDRSVEAANHLAKLVDTEEELSTWTGDILPGVFATFGDSLPLEGLTEAANETAKVGKVVGPMADAINWASGSVTEWTNSMEGHAEAQAAFKKAAAEGASAEDAFNAALAACSDEQERQAIITQSLSGIYGSASQAYKETNADVIAANEANEQLKGQMAEVGAAIQPVITLLTQMATGGLALLGPVFQQVGNLAQGMSSIITSGFQRIKEVIDGAFTPEQQAAISGFFEKLGQALLAVPLGILEAGVNAVVLTFEMFIDVGSAVVDAISSIIEWFSNFRENVSNAVSSVAEKINNWGSTVVSDMTTAASNAVSAVVEWFSSLPGKIYNAIISAVDRVKEWGADVKKAAEDKFEEVKTAIVKKVEEIPDRLKQAGRDLVQGLINGINEKINNVRTAAGNMANTVISTVTGLFKEHSPSRVMIQVGKYVGEGLAIGIDATKRTVKKAASSVANTVTKEVSKLNDEIEAITAAATKRQADKEEAEYQKNLKEKYDALAKAEIKERSKLQAEIDKLEADHNEKQLKAQEDAQKKALQSQVKSLEAIKSEYEKALSDVEKTRDDMANKLGDVDLYTEEDDFFRLTDLQKSIDAINKYGDTIQALKDRGIADSLLSEVLGMDQEKAVQYAQKLLAMGDEQYDAYMSLWAEKEAAAKKVAESIYQSEIDAIEEAYSDKLPAELKPAGQTAMDALTSGLVEGGKATIAAAKSIADSVLAELARIKAADSIRSAGRSESSFVSNKISSSSAASRERQTANQSAQTGTLASVMSMVNSAQGKARDIVLTLNGKEVARGLIDDIRAVEDQSPRIVSD